mmetsp:Transcript_7739/g.22993  ORF Transcript_7739/g.22993 Transcript_7739/m.22993 type:complete len:277 (-) Transcript_7739:83-913(-)
MTTACSTTPMRSSAPASRSTSFSSNTPMTTRCAPAAFVSGPSRLKAVRTPSARRTGATKRIAGWFLGAYRKPRPTSSMHRVTSARSSSRSRPSASSTSAAPQADDTDRLPHLVTLAPQAAARIAEHVLRLMVHAPSPPVPTMSRSVPAVSTRTHASRMAVAAPAISSGVSPFCRSVQSTPATCSDDALPSRNAPKRPRASSNERSSPSMSCDRYGLSDGGAAAGAAAFCGFRRLRTLLGTAFSALTGRRADAQASAQMVRSFMSAVTGLLLHLATL